MPSSWEEFSPAPFHYPVSGRQSGPLAVLTPKRVSQALSVANESTTTLDLTHRRDKSNIIYQKPIKNRHPQQNEIRV
jgi:hypothetical protein